MEIGFVHGIYSFVHSLSMVGVLSYVVDYQSLSIVSIVSIAKTEEFKNWIFLSVENCCENSHFFVGVIKMPWTPWTLWTALIISN